MDRNAIVEFALQAPAEAIRRTLTMAIRMAARDRYVVEVGDIYGDCQRFSQKGHAQLRPVPDFSPDLVLAAYKGQPMISPEVGWFEIDWKGSTLEFVQCLLHNGHYRAPFTVLLAQSAEVAEELIVALERFSSQIDEAVLVFQDGCWRHDEDLFEDIRTSTFDNLVLPAGMAEQVREDVQGWLDFP
jgi:hypothetical protein